MIGHCAGSGPRFAWDTLVMSHITAEKALQNKVPENKLISNIWLKAEFLAKLLKYEYFSYAK